MRPETSPPDDYRQESSGREPLFLIVAANRNVHLIGFDFADKLRNGPVDIVIDLDLEMIHGLQGLVVLGPEGHLTLGRIPGHAFHGLDQVFRIPVIGALQRLGDGKTGRHATGSEEIRRRTEALVVLGDEPVVDRIAWVFK